MKYFLMALMISFVYAALAYVSSFNWILALGVLIAYFLVFWFLIAPMAETAETTSRKSHEAYRFVHAFFISLSVSHSGNEAYDAARLGMSGEEAEIMAGLSNLTLEERLDYLTRYFSEDYYRVFVSLFRLYEEQGGDALKLADPLLREATLAEETAAERNRIRLADLGEFASLWFMSGLILAFLRYGLAAFYGRLTADSSFQALLGVYFVIALVSFVLYAHAASGEPYRFRRLLSHGAKSEKTKV